MQRQTDPKFTLETNPKPPIRLPKHFQTAKHKCVSIDKKNKETKGHEHCQLGNMGMLHLSMVKHAL